MLALSKWGPEVRRARIESAITPHPRAHAHDAHGDASAQGGAQGTQEGAATGERMEISEPPTRMFFFLNIIIIFTLLTYCL